MITVTAASGKYYMDGVEQGFVDLDPGTTYVFDVSHSSMGRHPLALSTTADGTHGGGSEYTDTDYSVGGDGTITLTVDDDTPILYYYCEAHPNMGGMAALEAPPVVVDGPQEAAPSVTLDVDDIDLYVATAGNGDSLGGVLTNTNPGWASPAPLRRSPIRWRAR